MPTAGPGDRRGITAGSHHRRWCRAPRWCTTGCTAACWGPIPIKRWAKVSPAVEPTLSATVERRGIRALDGDGGTLPVSVPVPGELAVAEGQRSGRRGTGSSRTVAVTAKVVVVALTDCATPAAMTTAVSVAVRILRMKAPDKLSVIDVTGIPRGMAILAGYTDIVVMLVADRSPGAQVSGQSAGPISICPARP